MLSEFHLNPAERRVAQAIIRGESPTQASRRLRMTQSRFQKIVRHLQQKTGSRDRIELIARLRTPAKRSPIESL